MGSSEYKGLMPAIITPFDRRGAVDEAGLMENVRFCLKAGCTGIVANGSTGEAVNLSAAERVGVIKAVAAGVPKGIKVIAGTGAPSTRETVSLTEEAIKAGAHAALVITPYNAIPNQKGLLKHYSEVARTGADIILYNLPEHTGVAIELDTIEALLKYKNIVGIKESSGDLVYLTQILQRFGGRIAALSGSDCLFFQCFATGAQGAILALGNIAPKTVIDVLRLVEKGRVAEARERYRRLLPIARAIAGSVNFPAPVKEAVRLLGRPAGAPRLPIMACDRRESDAIRGMLVYAGLLKK